MNPTQDGLSMIYRLPQEPNDIPRALTIKARGRFVQEKEQLRLASEFNSDCQPLSCFDSKTGDQSISEWLVFGSVPAKDKALCCFGPIFGDGRLNGCGGPFTHRSRYAKVLSSDRHSVGPVRQ